jgi:hypothetical protein
MTRILDTQEFARRFNQEEATWRRFHEKRQKRRLPGSDSPMPESLLDNLDWLAGEREIRTTCAVANKLASLPVREEVDLRPFSAHC